MHAFPYTTHVRNGALMEPSYTHSGMSMEQFYFASILSGMMASYPAIMTDPEHHIENAWSLAKAAARKSM